MDAYIRGIATFYGDSQNDPTNKLDDVDAYNMVNLHVGLKHPEGTWEVMLYGKNIIAMLPSATLMEEALKAYTDCGRSAAPQSSALQTACLTPVGLASAYLPPTAWANYLRASA